MPKYKVKEWERSLAKRTVSALNRCYPSEADIIITVDKRTEHGDQNYSE